MIELGFDFVAMASPCELRLVGASEAQLHTAARAAIAEVQRVEAKFSRYRGDSIIARINAAAGRGQPVEVDDETAALLDFGQQLHALSGGRFDVTSGVLRQAWNFRAGRLPEPAQVQALLPLIGWQHVRWAGRRIELPSAGMEVDFGGFGKEYAADRAAALVQSLGVPGGFVNLGGDIRVLGPRADGSAWRLALQHPRQAEAQLGQVQLSQGALATSGDYERCIVVDGRHYGHVLDARSGWPVQHWQSISVIAPTCAAAGALCTLAMLAEGKALSFLEQQGQAFIAVRHDGQVIDHLDRAALP